MIRIRIKFIYFLLLCAVSPVNITHAGEFTFLSHVIRPFTYEENREIKGFAVDIVKEMMALMKHSQEIKIYPFKRALQTVQRTSGHALFIVARRPERVDTLKWVGPLISSGVYFYKMKDSPIQIGNLQDVEKVAAIGVGLGNADHAFLLANGFTNISPVPNQLQSVRMLSKGRVDVVPISELVMPEMAKQAGIDSNRIERTGVKLYDSVLFLVFSKETPDATVAHWQHALDRLKDSGKYQQIYSEYVHH